MAWTVQQKLLVDALADALVKQRRAIRSACLSLKAHLDSGNYSAAYAAERAKQLGLQWQGWAAKVEGVRAEAVAALAEFNANASDFGTRFNNLNDAANACATATAANVGTRLQAVVDGLPEETVY